MVDLNKEMLLKELSLLTWAVFQMQRFIAGYASRKSDR